MSDYNALKLSSALLEKKTPTAKEGTPKQTNYRAWTVLKSHHHELKLHPDSTRSHWKA